MSAEQPFRITVYDKDFTRLGFVGDPLSLSVVPRHSPGIGTATLTLAADHRRVSDLMADGARVVIQYDDDQHLLSGPVRRKRGAGPSTSGTIEFDVEDDFRLFYRVLGWPVPGAALTAQTSAYDKRTGPAETVLKGYVTANAVQRLGLPVTVETDQARGGNITTALRFHPLVDRLWPAVDQSGVGVRVRQVGAGLRVECYTPTTYPRPLTELSGVVQSWSYSGSAFTVSRLVAGDQGEATARSFTASVDAAREAAWGDVVEAFVDARDADAPAEVAARRAEALADGAPRSGFAIELAETDAFRYGRTVKVGDRVTLQVGGQTETEVLREAQLSWTRDEGLLVTPVVGERTDDPDVTLARFISRLARQVRALGSTR